MEVRPIVRHALVVIAVAPLLANLIGSAFNIWYNTTQIQPLLIEDQPRLFARSVTIFNIVVYPVLVAVCVVRVRSLRTAFNALLNGVEPDPAVLAQARLRSINLPWFLGGVMAIGWVLAIPAILIGLKQSSAPVNQLVLFHLPTSIVIAAILTVTNGFFVAELLVERLLFPVLFRDESPAKIPGAISLPLGRRHLLCAIAACVCPVLCLVLLDLVHDPSMSDINWFMLFVAIIGIILGLLCSWMNSQHIVPPIKTLQAAAHEVADGNLEVHIDLPRADEFGPLIDEFNNMVEAMRSRRELRQRFGLHVGRRTAELILAQGDELATTEQEITTMFCDIRNFTARCAVTPASEIVPLLNRFLTMMVDVVENEHHGNVNKFLGNGFMALFGIGEPGASAISRNAQYAVEAGLRIIERLADLNAELCSGGLPEIGIGIGIHTGTAIGSVELGAFLANEFDLSFFER
jgi:adenylate cyclase